MPPHATNSSFNSSLVPTSIRLSITAVRTVVVSKVHIVKVVASQLVEGLIMLSVAGKLSQWHVSFDKVGTTPYFSSTFGELLVANKYATL